MTNFSISKTIGAIGPQGPTGPTGIIGPTGPSGSTSGGSTSNSSEFQINIPNQLTKIKKTINFSNKGTILPSDIICSLDNELLEQFQMYTFGPSIPNRWVSVGTGANDTIAYSSDNINWTGLGKDIFSDSGRSVAWNGRQWIAVGEGPNTIAYSDDGINWLPVNFTGANANEGFSKGNGIAWNEFGWVAVGKQKGNNKCFIQNSQDGINWSTCAREFTDEANGVACNGKIWVVVGTHGENHGCIVYAKADVRPLIFESTTINNNVPLTSMKSVAWNGSFWVAVGTSYILTSLDGITWDKSFPPIISNITTLDLNTVAWNGNVWVAGGKIAFNNSPTCPFIYSYDGVNWNPTLNIPISTEIYSVEWNGSIWIGIGDNNDAYSRDGIAWVKNKTNSLFTKGYGVSYNSARQNKILFPNQELYATGENGLIISTLKDNNWDIFFPPIPSLVFYDLATDGISKIIFANFLQTPDFTASMIILSKNFYDATFTPIIGTYTVRANAGAWNGKIWVSVGEGTNTIMYSNNIKNWTPITNIFSTSGNGIAYNANRWVAVGKDSTGKNIAYSDNGIDWFKSTSIVFSNGGKGLAHNGNRWVAVGADSNDNTIYYSDDNGKTWISAFGTTFSISGNGVAWNGSMWVAVGEDSNTNNNILISPDGITWNSVGDNIFTIQGNSVVWVKDRWFAGGEGTNTMYSSKNGSTWDIVSNPLTTKITNLSTNFNTPFIDIPNEITVNKNDKLDIVSGAYYNNSYTNFSCNIKPTFDSN
jgi:hypothetical protein